MHHGTVCILKASPW